MLLLHVKVFGVVEVFTHQLGLVAVEQLDTGPSSLDATTLGATGIDAAAAGGRRRSPADAGTEVLPSLLLLLFLPTMTGNISRRQIHIDSRYRIVTQVRSIELPLVVGGHHGGRPSSRSDVSLRRASEGVVRVEAVRFETEGVVPAAAALVMVVAAACLASSAARTRTFATSAVNDSVAGIVVVIGASGGSRSVRVGIVALAAAQRPAAQMERGTDTGGAGTAFPAAPCWCAC